MSKIGAKKEASQISVLKFTIDSLQYPETLDMAMTKTVNNP